MIEKNGKPVALLQQIKTRNSKVGKVLRIETGEMGHETITRIIITGY